MIVPSILLSNVLSPRLSVEFVVGFRVVGLAVGLCVGAIVRDLEGSNVVGVVEGKKVGWFVGE